MSLRVRIDCSGTARPQPPARTFAQFSLTLRVISSTIARAWSATSSVQKSGTLHTGIPRAAAAARSTLSTPMLHRTMILQFRMAAMTSAVTGANWVMT
jgi:hypothetical protein